MSRVLWIGDWASTGFGRASEELCNRLVDRGHQVTVLGVNYRGDSKPSKVSLMMAGGKNPTDLYGYTRVVEALGSVMPHAVILFNDPFICVHYLFRNQFDPDLVLLKYKTLFSDRTLITYQPRDGLNGPRGWDTLRQIKVNGEWYETSHQIAMSKFGQAQMPGSDLAYHGIDSGVFRPVSPQHPVYSRGKKISSKRDAKQLLGYSPNSFLILRVDKNSWRKDFASTWKALVPVMKRHSDIVVHFHCSGTDPAAGGVQMPELFTRDPETAARFKMPHDFSDFTGWNVDDLVALYNAADLFVSTSQGEGFGLTLGEALACGVPVIAQNVSSIPEVVGPGGILIDGGYEVTAPGGQDMFAANIGAFSEAIEHLYLNDGFRKRYAKAGLQHVRETFKWDEAADVFDRAIREGTEQVQASA